MSEVATYLRGLPWQSVVVSVVDVLIVALIIYRVLVLIRGTRAAYMLVGLLVVAGVYFGARVAQLTTLRWLLDNVFTYLLLIVIIVFQADIRRGLLRMGRRMFSGGPGSESAVLERVVEACETMAARRVGALLVFEREVDLRDVVQSGTAIDARASSELLVSLFSPSADNPLHDGAVIIRGARLTEAGVLLPLSSNPAIDRELGTRHRAGLGVTEETDAVAVVVSEQRGTVSVCHQGMMRTGLRGAALRRELLALLAGAGPRRSRRLPGWLSRLFAPLVREVPPTAEVPQVDGAGQPRRATGGRRPAVRPATEPKEGGEGR